MSEPAPRPAYPPPSDASAFDWEFGAGLYPVAVYGLGKMGLPIAAVFADETGSVVGVDVDESVAAAVAAGRSPVAGEPGLDDLVARTVDAGALAATTDGAAAAAEARIHVIVVPTLVDDGDPDLSALDAAVDDVAAGLAPGDAVFVESTVPPRTTVDRVLPRLCEGSGLDPGEFALAFCPERTMSGRAIEDVRGTYPKIVGGVDADSTETARLVYERINDSGVVPVADATAAEAVKVFEGLYRDVNIALANELARFADAFDVDVRAAIDAANGQPYCDIHDPGAGVGGHCIPYYPQFVIGEYDRPAPLLRTARAVNDGMPAFAVARLLDGLADLDVRPAESTVAVLGVTYRPGVAETRATPARPIVDELEDRGATVVAVDPMVDALPGTDVDVVDPAAVADTDLDGAVLVTAHDAFDGIDWTAFAEALAVVDGRDALSLGDSRHHVYTIGRGRA